MGCFCCIFTFFSKNSGRPPVFYSRQSSGLRRLAGVSWAETVEDNIMETRPVESKRDRKSLKCTHLGDWKPGCPNTRGGGVFRLLAFDPFFFIAW